MASLSPLFAEAEAEITKLLPATKRLSSGTRIVFDAVPDPDATTPSVYFGVDHGRSRPISTGEGSRDVYSGAIQVVASGNGRTARKQALDDVAEIASIVQNEDFFISAGHRVTIYQGSMIAKTQTGAFTQFNWQCPFRREVPAG